MRELIERIVGGSVVRLAQLRARPARARRPRSARCCRVADLAEETREVEVEFQERYWYPDDGGEVWVAGYSRSTPTGRFIGPRRAAAEGLLVAHVAGAVHRPDALDLRAAPRPAAR